jgi:hypothetical protein
MEFAELEKRKTGIFSTKIFVGHLVAEKTIDDFKTEEEYRAYQDSVMKSEFIVMREASTEETKLMGNAPIKDDIIARLPPEKQVEYHEKKNKEASASSDAVIAIAKKCVVGSSFTQDSKPAPLDKVADILFSSAMSVNYIIEKWMAGSVVFQKKSDEKSPASAE